MQRPKRNCPALFRPRNVRSCNTVKQCNAFSSFSDSLFRQCDIFRVQFTPDSVASLLGGNGQRRAAAGERVQHRAGNNASGSAVAGGLPANGFPFMLHERPAVHVTAAEIRMTVAAIVFTPAGTEHLSRLLAFPLISSPARRAALLRATGLDARLNQIGRHHREVSAAVGLRSDRPDGAAVA